MKVKNIRNLSIKAVFENEDDDDQYFIDLILGQKISFPPDLCDAVEFILDGYKRFYNIRYLEADNIPKYYDDDQAIEKYLQRKNFMKYSAIFLHNNMDNLILISFTPEIENIIFDIDLIYKSIESSDFMRYK